MTTEELMHPYFYLGVLANIGDKLTTYIGLSMGYPEGNPIMLFGMNTIGIVPLLLLAAIVTMIALSLNYVKKSSLSLQIMSLALFGIAFHNMLIISGYYQIITGVLSTW